MLSADDSCSLKKLFESSGGVRMMSIAATVNGVFVGKIFRPLAEGVVRSQHLVIVSFMAYPSLRFRTAGGQNV